MASLIIEIVFSRLLLLVDGLVIVVPNELCLPCPFLNLGLPAPSSLKSPELELGNILPPSIDETGDEGVVESRRSNESSPSPL